MQKAFVSVRYIGDARSLHCLFIGVNRSGIYTLYLFISGTQPRRPGVGLTLSLCFPQICNKHHFSSYHFTICVVMWAIFPCRPKKNSLASNPPEKIVVGYVPDLFNIESYWEYRKKEGNTGAHNYTCKVKHERETLRCQAFAVTACQNYFPLCSGCKGQNPLHQFPRSCPVANP